MRKKICFVTTIGATIKAFLLSFGNYLVEQRNYDVTFICADDDGLSKMNSEHIHFIPVPMSRGVNLDAIKVIGQLKDIFKEQQFDIVQYATPNAAFYASIAARRAGVKNRLYTHWGSRYMGYDGGIGRFIFRVFEKITCHNSTIIETESFSLLEYSLKDKLYDLTKASVIWNGSACGVKLEDYDLSKRNKWREQIREQYNIPKDSVVFGWCGRITRDKGHNELFAAFKQLNEHYKNARLLVVGPYDNADTIDADLLEWTRNCKEVIFTGPVLNNQVAEMYSAMDVFCSLSYREGFGLVVIEAAAMKLPGIVTNVPGQVDTIVNGETGLLVPAKEITPVVDAMEYFVNHLEMIEKMGIQARRDIEIKYEQRKLFSRLADHRDEIIKTTKV